MTWATITGAGTTTATKFHGDVMNKINNMLGGTDVSDTVSIHSNVTWTFGSGAVIYSGATSGTTTLNATAVAGTTVLTLPAATDTLIGKATTDILTNKSISLTTNTVTGTSAELATAISDETGTGVLVFGTAPTISSPSLSYAVNAQTGTTYTPVLLDAGKVVTTSNAAAITLTIPPNSSVAYPVGSSINVISIGAGLTTFAQGAGVTINSTGATATAPIIRAQHSSATAIKTATDTWQVVGDIS